MRKSFPGYPHLKAGFVHTQRYGDVRLTSVTPTSDGFLIGSGVTRSGTVVYNLFLGSNPTAQALIDAGYPN